MNTEEKIFASYESSIARIILYCLSELPVQFGQKKICDTLCGSNATFIVDHKLHELTTYGALSSFTRAQLYLVVGSLLEDGYIVAEDIEKGRMALRVLGLTEKGGKFILSDEVKEFGFKQLIFDPVINKLKNRDFELFAQLRIITKRIASSKGVPCYTVLAPRPMLEMTLEKPTTKEHLQGIYAIRKDFGEKFADDYLPVIRGFVTEAA